MNKDFEYSYTDARDKRKRKMKVEKQGKPPGPFNLLKKIFLSNKPNNSMVRKLTRGELTAAQLKQVHRAIISGLSDKQIDAIINSRKDAARMSEIIDIAITLNKKGGGR